MDFLYDQVKQQMRPQSDRPTAIRKAIYACRKGGSVVLPQRMARGELPTRHLATHPMNLDDGPKGYHIFKEKQDGCVRAVFLP